jgi:hypothetical protein
MAEPIPTQRGDALILRTDQSFTIHVVGQVSQDGQQDFSGRGNLKCEIERAAAVVAAKLLVWPARRIFLRNIDTGDWSEISH